MACAHQDVSKCIAREGPGSAGAAPAPLLKTTSSVNRSDVFAGEMQECQLLCSQAAELEKTCERRIETKKRGCV